jgi:hypothetical protein
LGLAALWSERDTSCDRGCADGASRGSSGAAASCSACSCCGSRPRRWRSRPPRFRVWPRALQREHPHDRCGRAWGRSWRARCSHGAVTVQRLLRES